MQRHEQLHSLFYRWCRALFISVGHDIYQNGGFKRNLYTFYIYALIVLLEISIIYTIVYYDWFTRLNAIPILAISLQVSHTLICNALIWFLWLFSKSPTFRKCCPNLFFLFGSQLIMKIYSVKYADHIVELVNKLVDIYRVNSEVNNYGRQEMLDRYLMITAYLFKVGLTLYTLATFGYFINPLYQYIVNNEMIPFIFSYFPFVDETTTTGFTIITILHLQQLIEGLLGTACTDFSFTMIIVNVPVLSNIFCDGIKDLNALLKDKRPKLVMIKVRLLNTILQHREITQWVDRNIVCIFNSKSFVSLELISSDLIRSTDSLTIWIQLFSRFVLFRSPAQLWQW